MHPIRGPESPPNTRLVRKFGHLALTFHPPCHGGCNKGDATNALRTHLATILLQHGVLLKDTEKFIEALLEKTGTATAQTALHTKAPAGQWQALMALAKQHRIELPPQGAHIEKAARRIQGALRRKRAQVCGDSAAEFQLRTGFFLNADDSPCQILTQIRPACTGVTLLTAQDALRALEAYQGKFVDELGLIILGHTCPQPASCSGRVDFPAVPCQDPDGLVVLAGCLHNVGAAKVHWARPTDQAVAGPDTVQCSFTVLREEVSPESWQQLQQSPVRVVQTWFKGDDAHDPPFSRPWARSFRYRQKPSPPAVADCFHFFAQVTRDALPGLLKMSGHNSVCVVAKGWDGKVLEEFGIIWCAASRQQAAEASLNIPAQHGLAMARGRWAAS